MKKVDRYKKNLLQGASSFLVVSFAVANGAAAIAATVTVPGSTGTIANDAVTSAVTDQANTDTADTITRVTATSAGSAITRDEDAVVNGDLSVDSNTFGATAVGNTAPRAVSRTGLASLTDSAGLVVRQANTAVPVSATTSGTVLSVTVGDAAATNGLGTVSGSAIAIGSNADSASATGNTTSQALTLDATTLAVGTAAGSLTADGTDLAAATAGASITTVQANSASSSVSAANTGSQVSLTNTDDVGLSAGTSLSVDNNLQQASATGSDSASTLNLSGATLSGSAAVLTVQDNAATAVSATLTNGRATLTIANTTSDATAAVAGNTQQASATGMSSANSLTESGTTLTLGTGSADLSTSGTAAGSAAGSALVTNLQSGDATSPVTATNTGAALSLSVTDASGTSADSSFSLSGNAQQAVATAMETSNTVVLEGTTVGSSAGALNVQANAGAVSSAMTGGAALNIADAASGSSVDLSGNRLQATAASATAINSVDVTATSVTIDAADGLGSSVAAGGSDVTSAYGVLNDQIISGDVSASVLPAANSAAFTVDVGGAVTAGSIVSNDSNLVSAKAQGAVGVNSIDLNIGGTLSTTANVAAETFANAASVTNSQTVSAGTDVTASAAPNGTSSISTEIGGAVTNAAVSTSGNRQQAMADGASATNSLSVNATTLSVAGGASATAPATYTAAGLAGSTGGTLSTDAALSVANSQSGAGTVTAALRDPAYSGTGTVLDPGIRTAVAGAVTASDISADGNYLDTFATSNKATNSAAVVAATLSTTASVSNAQTSNAQIAAQNYGNVAGYDGVANATVSGTVQSNSAGTTAGFTSAVSGSTLTVTDGEVIRVDLSGLSSEELVDATRYLEARGFDVTGTTAVTTGNGSYDLSAFTSATLTTGTGLAAGTFSFTGFNIDGLENGGVVTTVDGNIADSSLSVDGNAARGSSISNSATNSLSVLTTTLTAEGGNTTAVATTADSDTVTAAADYTVLNAQELGAAATSTTTVLAAFGIDQANGTSISGSELSVSGNVQFGEALGNSAANSLNVSAVDGGSGGTAALASVQEGTGADISATTEMEVYADVTSTDSSIALNGNRNTALASVNNVSNSLTASATNMGDGGSALVGATAVTADFALNNLQDASGTLDSSATTTIYNSDVAADLGGLNGSTLSIAGNSTTAEATANRATNLMSVYGSADLGAAAGLANRQTSDTDVTASATSSMEVDLNGGLLATDLADGSSIAVDGNSTTALARGNYANNAMSFEAGAYYSVGDTSVIGATTQASAAVYNQQSNLGDVSASSVDVSYGVVLNNLGATGSTALQNSTASVSNNSVNAYAFGNAASNTLTMAALNTGMPSAAVNSFQSNSGAITATVTNVTFAASAFGAGSGSSSSTSGNSVVAQAVGNSAVSVMGAR